MGLQNDSELLRILNYWSLNYRGSAVSVAGFTVNALARHFKCVSTTYVSLEKSENIDLFYIFLTSYMYSFSMK